MSGVPTHAADPADDGWHTCTRTTGACENVPCPLDDAIGEQPVALSLPYVCRHCGDQVTELGHAAVCRVTLG